MTRKQLKKFITKNPITNGESAIKYEYHIKTIDDGDTYHRLTLPVWYNNQPIQIAIAKLLLSSIETHGCNFHCDSNNEKFPHNTCIVIDFYEYYCDPD